MRTIIIEDDHHKLERLRSFVVARLPESEIRECRAYQPGLKSVVLWNPDLVILDMSLPTYEISPLERGGRSRPFAGRDILHQIKRRNLITKVVIVTQFDSFGSGTEELSLQTLRDQLMAEYKNWFVGLVYYNPSETRWHADLERQLSKVTGA